MKTTDIMMIMVMVFQSGNISYKITDRLFVDHWYNDSNVPTVAYKLMNKARNVKSYWNNGKQIFVYRYFGGIDNA